MPPVLPDLDPELDLVLDRVVPVPVAHIWRAWTDPEQLMPWFCPRPWRTTACGLDVRPGGRFHTVMEGPAGERHESTGCFLEVVPERRLVWTDALGPGFRPQAGAFMTAFLLLEPVDGGTRYVAVARHASAESRAQHEEMGFHQGWSAALDQLVAHVAAW